MKLTNRQAFWGFVWGMFVVFVGGPFVIDPVLKHEPVTNLTVIFMGFIVTCLLVVGLVRIMRRIPDSKIIEARQRKIIEELQYEAMPRKRRRPNLEDIRKQERKRNFGFK
jgi:Na+/proline symporter